MRADEHHVSTNGIFITAELTGPVGAQVRDLQRRFDPKLANELPPHITILGSSGAGPISPDTPVPLLRALLTPVAEASPPLHLTFQRPLRFLGREIAFNHSAAISRIFVSDSANLPVTGITNDARFEAISISRC